MRYDDSWVPPWRQTEQARCKGDGCTHTGTLPGCLVIASTLDPDGLCAACGRTADETHRELRMGV